MTVKQKILIVDDRRENLFALQQVLTELEAEVIEATSGNEALAATLHHDFAVAILDVQMPGMTGYELAELLRQGFSRARRSRTTGEVILERSHYDAVCGGQRQNAAPQLRLRTQAPQLRAV